MAFISQLLDSNVQDKDKRNVNLIEHCGNKIVGLYFSAHWCNPCRGFTPILIDFYNKYKENKNFEVIFISSDRSYEEFEEYYNQMPWLVLTYNEREKKTELSNMLKIDGIPTLVLLNADTGEILNADAVQDLEDSDPDQFPWKNTVV